MSKILNICNQEKAISNGNFFDLMYVNYDNPSLNPHDHYVFLRNFENETLLIAVNFRSSSCDLKINIPRHAFNTLSIPEGKFEAVELLYSDKNIKAFSSEIPFETFIQPYNAVVWKINHKKSTQTAKK